MRLLNTLLNVSYRLKGTGTLQKPSIFQGLGHTTHLFPSLSTMPKGCPLQHLILVRLDTSLPGCIILVALMFLPMMTLIVEFGTLQLPSRAKSSAVGKLGMLLQQPFIILLEGRPLKKPSTNNTWNISEHILAFLFSHHNQDSNGLPPPLYPHNFQAISSNYLVPGSKLLPANPPSETSYCTVAGI